MQPKLVLIQKKKVKKNEVAVKKRIKEVNEQDLEMLNEEKY